MDLSRFTNIPVMLMLKSGNLVSRLDTTITNLSVDADSVLIAHDHGEITMFRATVQDAPQFVTITEAETWSLTIFLTDH